MRLIDVMIDTGPAQEVTLSYAVKNGPFAEGVIEFTYQLNGQLVDSCLSVNNEDYEGAFNTARDHAEAVIEMIKGKSV